MPSELRHIVPAPGMKQGVETRLAPEGTLMLAQNVRWEKPGRIVKRGGAELIGSDLPAASVGGSWIHEDYACVDDRVFGYDASAGTWLSLGTDLGLDHPFYPIGRFPAVLTEASGNSAAGGAYYTTIARVGTTLVVATSGPGATSPGPTVTIVGMSDEGRVLWRLAPFAGVRPRLVLAGATLRVVYQTDGGGIRTRTVTAAGTLGSETTLVADGNAIDFFDASALAGVTHWALAYHSGTDITITRYDGTTVNATRLITTTAAPQQIAVAGGGATNDTIWVVWHDGTTNGLLYSPEKWDLSTPTHSGSLILAIASSATEVPSGQPAVLRLSASEAMLACTFNLFSASPLSLSNPTVQTRLSTNSGSGGGTTVKHHGWRLASKAWPEPASSVSPRRIRFLVNAWTTRKHGILEVGTDAAGGAIVGITYEREGAITDQITDAVVYDPGDGNSRVATVCTWVARFKIGGGSSQLLAADLLLAGARHLGGGSRRAVSAARSVHRGPFGSMHYVAGGASLVELQPMPAASARVFPHNGFAVIPELRVAIQAGGNLTAATTYTYRAAFEHLDAAGQRCRSEPSGTITVAADASNRTARLHANVPGGTGRASVTLHIYRAWNGGPFYRVTPNSGAPLVTDAHGQPTGAHVSYDDALSDADASLRELLDTGSLPNAPPSGARIVAMGGGRMFATDWMGRIQVSKLIVAGEPVQFVDDDAFRIFPPEAPTGLAVLDGTLVIFTAQRIYLVAIGLGPTDQGLNPYDVPQAVPTDDGCVDWRSVLVVSQGVLYQSRRGIMLLPRGFGAPSYVGEDVADEVNGSTAVIGSARSARPDGTELAYFLVGPGELGSALAKVVVLDLALGAWSVDLHASRLIALGQRRNRLAYVIGDAVANVARWLPESTELYSDRNAAGSAMWIEMRLRFAQLRPFGPGGSGTFHRALALFEPQKVTGGIAECALTIESELDEALGVRHAGDQPEKRTWQIADDFASSMVQANKALYLGLELRDRGGTSLDLELYDAAPDSGSVFTAGVAFHAFSLEVEPGLGLRRLQKELQK